MRLIEDEVPEPEEQELLNYRVLDGCNQWVVFPVRGERTGPRP